MQRFKFLLSVTIVVLIIFMIGSCSDNDLDETNEDTCTTEISYANDVNSILQTKCNIAGCHNGSLGDARDWTDFETLKSRAQAVKQMVENRQMPPPSSPAGQLSADQIQTISCWVDQGALNN